MLLEPCLHDSTQEPLPVTLISQVEHRPEVVFYVAAIQAAVASKRPEAVNMILKRGRQRRDGTQLFDYALEVAAWMGDKDMVSLLLSHGADVSHPRPSPGFHLIAQATQHGMHDLVERLIDNGTDVATLSWDGHGMSILEYAAINNHPSIIKLAMEHGASVITANMVLQITAFHDAASRNHFKCIQALFDGTFARDGKEEALRLVNLQTTQYGETALHQAARLGNCDSVALLLDLGATDMKDREGYNAFQRTVAGGDVNVLRIFLSKAWGSNESKTPRPSSGSSHAQQKQGQRPGSTNRCPPGPGSGLVRHPNETDEGYYTNSLPDAQSFHSIGPWIMNPRRQNMQNTHLLPPSVYFQHTASNPSTSTVEPFPIYSSLVDGASDAAEEAKVNALYQLGIPRAQAENLLRATEGSLDEAAELAFSSGPIGVPVVED